MKKVVPNKVFVGTIFFLFLWLTILGYRQYIYNNETKEMLIGKI